MLKPEPTTREAYAQRLCAILGERWEWILPENGTPPFWLGFIDDEVVSIDDAQTRWEVRGFFGEFLGYGATPIRALRIAAKERRQQDRQEEVKEARAAGCGTFGRAAFHVDRAGAIRRVMWRRWGHRDESEAGRWAAMLVARHGRERTMLVGVWREEMAKAKESR